jgi:ZIP family zinc transporter
MLFLRLLAMVVHMLDHDKKCHNAPEQGPQIRSASPGAVPDALPDAEPGLTQGGAAQAPEQSAQQEAGQEDTDKQLHAMGLNTALAIALHNFPEGLATFVATLADESVGVTLAIAIAIHNIPEGLCVALPIYYSSKSRYARHKGFFWALLSGISEPIGALIGYLIIKSSGEDMDNTVYGILFGAVGGMMIMIVLLELLPTALRYDPADKYVTNSVVMGMLVMALSLVLFTSA